MTGTILKEAAAVQKQIDQALSALEKATKDFDIEVSLRSMRKVIPAVCQAVINEIDKQIHTINSRWPKTRIFGKTVEVPGRKEAIGLALKIAEPYKRGLRALSSAVQQADNAKTRAALKQVLQEVIKYSRLTIKVPVLGTVFSKAILSSQQVAQLNMAIQAIDKLPAISDLKAKAQQIYNAIPQRATLRQVAKNIQQGIQSGIPKIEAITFRVPLSSTNTRFQVTVVIRQASGRTTLPTLTFDPGNPAALGSLVARAFTASLK